MAALCLSSAVSTSASTQCATFQQRAGGVALPKRSMLGRSFAGKAIAPRAVRVARPAARGALKVVAAVATDEEEMSAMEKYDYETREVARKYRRNVYGPAEWRRHRSVGRYSRHLSSMFSSSVVKGLLLPVGVCTFGALAVCLTNDYATEWLPSAVSIPMQPFTLSAPALSLLLVFRTNASYGRWWEARKIWGGLLNRSRDFMRQGVTWMAPEDVLLKEQLLRYTTAFAFSLKVHLRGDEIMRDELTGILTPRELEVALDNVHVPNHILRMISAIVAKAELNPIMTTQMDENITFFHDVLGKCERILKTPIPLSYTRHTSRFLLTWLLLLPLGIWDSCHWLSIPAEAFIALFLLGIEDIGVQIEEPFSILSCEAICGSVKNNTASIMEMQERDNALIETSVSKGTMAKVTTPASW
mmetsp:Transcript_3713/g.6340  ORF Transcript_3713/g.6340 Transcript_3713/m.6340 type:complete len:415 (+) Transcript_3713:78-1322(+)|eukprot:CAMPEP_0198196854 /NCGR_PEP_ID=MMETSP1445-20131203/309_1 /TAXON_ID=36898 /ORGANISM="Pyramimonas sp., Strain CCMP2087" /LENGTH=414 /DNA_ID=CAMNT_0043865867 /DNA_START=75 /DNA_END=1319 /DNA_ORIENTATION=+